MYNEQHLNQNVFVENVAKSYYLGDTYLLKTHKEMITFESGNKDGQFENGDLKNAKFACANMENGYLFLK